MNSETAWKSAEQLVAFLEKVISPDAIIQHDVYLPVRGQKRKRQCDVVVRLGKVPREQIIIVEVQKRNRKPDLTTFHGWVKKMEEVGANALFCVSAKGFPPSIIEDVDKHYGDRVKLMTLSPIDHPAKLWADFHLAVTIAEITLVREIGATGSLELFDPMSKELRIDVRNPILSLTGRIENAESLAAFSKHCWKDSDIADLFIADPALKTVKAQLSLHGTEKPIWLHVAGNTARIKKWDVEIIVKQVLTVKEHKLTKWAYSQQHHDGVLVWVATAQTVTTSGRFIALEIAFLPTSNGRFETKVNFRGEIKWDCQIRVSPPFG